MQRVTTKQWLGLAVVVLPSLVFSMDLTVLSLALPHISLALHTSDAQLLAIADASTVCLALTLIVAGWLGDRWGHRRLLLLGILLFGLGSLGAALSTEVWQLVAARIITGVGAASIAPATLALLHTMFEDAKSRRLAMGVWVASLSLGGAVGPFLGGVILQHFWWGAVFLMGVPVAAAVLLLGPLFLPNSKSHITPPLDFFVLRLPVLRIALALQFAVFFVNLPVFIFASRYLQTTLGMSPMLAGTWLLASGAGFLTGSLGSARFSGRLGSKKAAIASLLVASVGFSLLALTPWAGLWAAACGLFVYSLGLAPLIAIGANTTVSAVPAGKTGVASGLGQTAVQLGAACGVAVLGTLGAATPPGLSAVCIASTAIVLTTAILLHKVKIFA